MDHAVDLLASGGVNTGSNISSEVIYYPWASTQTSSPSVPYQSFVPAEGDAIETEASWQVEGGAGGREEDNGLEGQETVTTTYIAVFSSLFFSVGAVGICGNAMVIYIILSDKKMRGSMTNMLILNLALADSLIMLFGVPEIVLFMLNDGWRLGTALCKLNRTVLVAALYSSVLTLVAVCIERYIAIVFPFKAHVLSTRARIWKVIALIWFASSTCATPTAVFNRIRRLSNTTPQDFCITEFHPNRSMHVRYYQAFKYTESVLFYLLPLVLQMICYTVIGTRLFVGLGKLHRSSGGGKAGSVGSLISARDGNSIHCGSPAVCKPGRSNNCGGAGRSARCDYGGYNSTPRLLNGRSKSSIHQPVSASSSLSNNDPIRSRRGVVKMLMASVIIYFVSYSPHQVLLIYNTFWRAEDGFDQTWLFHVFTTILAYVNSAANPVLYCVFSDNFRSKFKVIFGRLACLLCFRRSCTSSDRPPRASAEVQRAITMHSFSYTTEYSTMIRKSQRLSAPVPL